MKDATEERKAHKYGQPFAEFFDALIRSTRAVIERDVLRASKELLWEQWKVRLSERSAG